MRGGFVSGTVSQSEDSCILLYSMSFLKREIHPNSSLITVIHYILRHHHRLFFRHLCWGCGFVVPCPDHVGAECHCDGDEAGCHGNR